MCPIRLCDTRKVPFLFLDVPLFKSDKDRMAGCSGFYYLLFPISCDSLLELSMADFGFHQQWGVSQQPEECAHDTFPRGKSLKPYFRLLCLHLLLSPSNMNFILTGKSLTINDTIKPKCI